MRTHPHCCSHTRSTRSPAHARCRCPHHAQASLSHVHARRHRRALLHTKRQVSTWGRAPAVWQGGGIGCFERCTPPGLLRCSGLRAASFLQCAEGAEPCTRCSLHLATAPGLRSRTRQSRWGAPGARRWVAYTQHGREPRAFRPLLPVPRGASHTAGRLAGREGRALPGGAAGCSAAWGRAGGAAIRTRKGTLGGRPRGAADSGAVWQGARTAGTQRPGAGAGAGAGAALVKGGVYIGGRERAGEGGNCAQCLEGDEGMHS